MGLNSPGSHTLAGGTIAPVVQAASWSWRFSTSAYHAGSDSTWGAGREPRGTPRAVRPVDAIDARTHVPGPVQALLLSCACAAPARAAQLATLTPPTPCTPPRRPPHLLYAR